MKNVSSSLFSGGFAGKTVDSSFSTDNDFDN